MSEEQEEQNALQEEEYEVKAEDIQLDDEKPPVKLNLIINFYKLKIEEDEETKKLRLEREEQERILKEEREEAEKKQKEEADAKFKEDLTKFQEFTKTGVSGLSKIADGSTFAFVKMNLAEKEIDRIYDTIQNFRHLKYLDVSQNKLSDLTPVSCLKFLVNINASKNEVNNMSCFQEANAFPYLQYLNLQSNKIVKLQSIALPRLRRLNLNENEIVSCGEFKGHSNLQVMELRKNKLKNTTGLQSMPELLELYLAENEINDFRQLSSLPKLFKLNLRKNNISKIKTPVPELQSLYHLNLRENQLTKFEDIRKIAKIRNIQSINILANPISDEMGEGFKVEILMFYQHFLKVNKIDVTQEEIGLMSEAVKVLEERIQEEERKRIEEEENKKLAEEEAKKNAEEEAAQKQPQDEQQE